MSRSGDRPKPTITVAAQELDRVLHEDGSPAVAIREKVHRVQLSRYRNGWERPGHEVARLLDELSGGRVRHGDWAIPAQGSDDPDHTSAA